jgi:hypothetical protein
VSMPINELVTKSLQDVTHPGDPEAEVADI